MKLAGLLLLTLCIGVAACRSSTAQGPSESAPSQVAPSGVLRVVTGQAPPFVFRQDGAVAGFSIDFWNALVQRLKVSSSLTELGLHSEREQLQALQHGDADVAVSAIAMTEERERLVDFSMPYFDSGLPIIVRVRNDSSILTAIGALLSLTTVLTVLAVLVVIFLLANVLWLVERRSNPQFQRGYLRGIVEGLWGVMLIIATSEHGDRDAPNVVKRLTVALMWLLRVVLIAQFTATITSALIVQQLVSNIQGPGDLPGKMVGTVPGSIAADYLTRPGIPYVGLASADDGYDALVRGKVQAIVYEAPTLQYWAATRGQGVLQVVDPVFRSEKYGIAVASGRPLRKPINEALLKMYADGSYENIYRKRFAAGK